MKLEWVNTTRGECFECGKFHLCYVLKSKEELMLFCKDCFGKMADEEQMVRSHVIREPTTGGRRYSTD